MPVCARAESSRGTGRSPEGVTKAPTPAEAEDGAQGHSLKTE